MEIRDCAIEDTDEICLLLVELNEALGEDMEIDRRTVESNLKEMLGEKSNYMNLAACEGGRIIGFISVVFYK
ncbi:MAG: hypothetical protein JW902_12520, partial [Syntrophaceae bacterium]|nr:hypothetical protein [Syntrophaceae bacterium]